MSTEPHPETPPATEPLNNHEATPPRPRTGPIVTPNDTDARPRPRTGPIVWGALILVFCGYIVQRTLAPGAIEPLTWAIASGVGLGVLLLVVGVAVIARGARVRGGPGL